jgi:hypothetical protein
MPAGILVTGDNTDNVLIGGLGNDTILALGGNDTIEAWDGDDSINAGSGNDSVYALEGNDSVLAGAGNDMVYAAGGADYISGFTGNDTLYGGSDNDILRGGSGNDSLQGDEGDDKLEGNEDDDTLTGGYGNDRLLGGDGYDRLFGDSGNDWMEGGNGNDMLFSGEGRDTLTGGAGADIFKYASLADSTATSLDIITDFIVGVDKIDLRGLGYTRITSGADVQGELRLAYSAASDRTYIRDDFSDFEIALKGDLRSTLTNNDILFGADHGDLTGKIGYYELAQQTGAQNPFYAAPIVENGIDAVSLETLEAEEIAGLKAIFLLNESNDGYGAEFLSALGTLDDFVFEGGTLVLHDRYVEGAESILPGWNGADIMRNFEDDATIEFVDETGVIANGVGGILDDSSLDNGTSSSHGFVIDGDLEPTTIRVHTTGNAENIVSFAYEYGEGIVYYSAIPLDYYLTSYGIQQNADYGVDYINQTMYAYATNVIDWVAQGSDLVSL